MKSENQAKSYSTTPFISLIHNRPIVYLIDKPRLAGGACELHFYTTYKKGENHAKFKIIQ